MQAVARLLYQLRQREKLMVTEADKEVGLDGGHLSRILRRLREPWRIAAYGVPPEDGLPS
jgi:hypothetical protein